MSHTKPIEATAPEAHTKTIYPAPFAARVNGRSRRRLGDHFGLSNFGVNLTELAPGAASALLHHHSKQDEFIYVLSGTPTLMLDDQAYLLKPGDCCGFKAGTGIGHHLVNNAAELVVYLEIGDRLPGDAPVYPDDDLKIALGNNGAWLISHKDGSPY